MITKITRGQPPHTNQQFRTDTGHQMKRLIGTITALTFTFAFAAFAVPGSAAVAPAFQKPPPGIIASLPTPLSAAPQSGGTYVGDAGEWAVGIVVSGSQALVYLCDGRNPGQWFGASVAKGGLLGTAANGSVLKATLKSGNWAGSVTLGKKPVSFTARPASPKNGFGIWRSKPAPFEGPGSLLGWISTANGVRGVTQNASGAVVSGLVLTADPKGRVVFNGVPIAVSSGVVPSGAVPTTTIVTQVQSAQVAGTGPVTTTIKPDPTKLCLLAFARYELARHSRNMAQQNGTSAATIAEAEGDLQLARERLDTCLAG